MKATLLATAATLALIGGACAATSQMPAGRVRETPHRVTHAPPRGMTTLYDQNSGGGSYGWVSQTLSSYPQYDEYVADDFIVPAGHTWKVKKIDTTGEYSPLGSGPASSVNVLFWKDNGGLPNKDSKLVECDNLAPASGLDTGSFQIRLPRSCKVRLKGGGTKGTRYWLTVQANMQGLETSGYWGWQWNQNVANKQDAGYYYGGSNGVKDPECLQQFETLHDCWSEPATDVAFALFGRDRAR